MTRVGPERQTRPLLMRPDPLGELRKLYAEREPMYQTADWTIDTERLAVQRVVDKIAELAATLGHW